MDTEDDKINNIGQSPATVLVIEDDKALLRLVRKKLSHAGFYTEGVSNGTDALNKITDNQFILILLDYGLPDMSGEQFIKKLDKLRIRVPFLVATGQGDEQIAVKMMKLGARDYVVKDSAFLDMLPQIVHVVVEQIYTEKRLAHSEEALREHQEKLGRIFESANDEIVVSDLNGVINDINKKGLEIGRFQSKNDLIGRRFLECIAPNDLERASCEMQQLLWEGKHGPSEFTLLRADGSQYPAEVTSSVIRDATGNPVGFINIVRDITERKQTEEKLLQLDRMKTEFISNVSHELRTPLQSIMGFAKLMLEDKVPDREIQREFLTTTVRQSEHLTDLINDLLDMSRLESGRFQIQKQRLSIRNVIREAIQSFCIISNNKGIAINEVITATLPEIEVDGKRVKQVITNLLSNAIKFSDSSSNVTVRGKVKDGQVMVQVIDQGIGIPNEAMPKLFERFYRIGDKMVREGAGLGLYISKQIIEAHGGCIWAESKAGEGSIFSFTLPLGESGDKSQE